MLSPSAKNFSSANRHSAYATLKPRKRRRRRQKIHGNSNSVVNLVSTSRVVKPKPLMKTIQYFQHDNRVEPNETEIKETPFISSCLPSFNQYKAEEIIYNEVAKKFKPINVKTKNKNFKKRTKILHGNSRKKKLKAFPKRNLKKCLALKTTTNNCMDDINATPNFALMQPQICLCLCRRNEHKCSDIDKLFSYIFTAINSTTTGSQNGIQHVPFIENDIRKILEHLQNHKPTNFLENNTQLLKCVDELKRVRDSHQISEAQEKKNAKLREAFSISEYFVEGSNFDSDRKAKEDLAKSLALPKKLDTQRDKIATALAKEKESSKRYPFARTPSMEHDVSAGRERNLAVDNSENASKRKKKKKTRESTDSPDRKKDKRKKSKKRKKESKPKKAKKLRKRKYESESDSYADNINSADEDPESEDEEKKGRKKWKKDKKKRKYKKKEFSSSSDKSRSASPSGKSTGSKKRELLSKKKLHSGQSRSHSKEIYYNRKESERRYNDSLQEDLNRCSRSRDKSNTKKLRSDSRNSRYRIERTDHNHVDSRHSNKRLSSRSRDYSSRECNDTRNSKENRKSRSRQRSKRETVTKRVKNIKRKHTEDPSQLKLDKLSAGRRKRYSSSHSSPNTKSRAEISRAKSTDIEKNKSRPRSRTPSLKSVDSQQKVNRSRSRSASVKDNLRERSFTPPQQTSKIDESEKSYKYSSNNLEKSNLKSDRSDFKDKKFFIKKIKSRTTSASSFTALSNNTESSKSRTPSPKEPLEKHSMFKRFDEKKQMEQKSKSRSRTRTPKLVERRSKSREVLNERNKSNKRRSFSRSEEHHEKSKEKRAKVEKKVLSSRSSRDSSELSYSPARRNPERYRDILENNKIKKTEKTKIDEKHQDKKEPAKSFKQSEEPEWDRKEKSGKNDRNQIKPVVRLLAQSDEDSDLVERNNENILDEFQRSKRESEIKDLKMLEQLKTGIAAKAKEKIKIIEKMAACTSTSSLSNDGREVSEKASKHIVRNSLNDFLAANNAAPAIVTSCSLNTFHKMTNSPPGATYPQTLEEIKKEQESVLQLTEISSHTEDNCSNKNNDTQQTTPLAAAAGNPPLLSSKSSPLRTNIHIINKDRDRKRERDFRERDQEKEINNFNRDRYLERRQHSSPIIYNMCGGGFGGGTAGGGGMVGGRRINNSTMLTLNHRQQRLNLMCNSGGISGHHHHTHSHLYQHHHHTNHKIINNHHSTTSSSSASYISNNSTNQHPLMCNHANNSAIISFNRPSRINNTPLITATQFNNQMLSKQSNSILVNRRDHRTALNLGLSGTPCTNFSNSNLLLTKANTNPHHLHAATVGHVVAGGHHHHHHHHHHSHNANLNSGGSNPATQIADRILMAASLAAAQRHSLGVAHSAGSSVASVADANNLDFLQQQNKAIFAIKPFKINDSQPLVAALADSSLVDAIVSKVSTATVAAAESAARRSRSRSRRSRSRNRHEEKRTSGANNSGGTGSKRDRNCRRSSTHSRSSSSKSSRSRSRSRSDRRSRSHSSQSSSSSHTSSHSSSSSSFGSTRSSTRSPSIPRRRGSPSFLDRRRITSARKRPIPYHRKLPSDVSSCYCSSCCSRDSSPRSRSQSRDSRSPSGFF